MSSTETAPYSHLSEAMSMEKRYFTSDLRAQLHARCGRGHRDARGRSERSRAAVDAQLPDWQLAERVPEYLDRVRSWGYNIVQRPAAPARPPRTVRGRLAAAGSAKKVSGTILGRQSRMMQETMVVAVGTPVSRPPRTDPYVKYYFIRLLPRVIDDQPLFGIRMQDAGGGKPSANQTTHPQPCPATPLLASAP